MLGRFLKNLFGGGTSGGNDDAKSDSRQAEIGQQVLALFEREREDAHQRLSSSYWGSGASNVGHAVLRAVTLSVAALLERSNTPIAVGEALGILERTREIYGNDSDDEDGYGIATFHTLVNGMEQIVEAEGESARFSTKVLAAFAPQDSTDPTEWPDSIYQKLSENSEFFRAVLDLYAAGDFAGVARTISELPDDQWPQGFTHITTLLHVNCMVRSAGKAALESMKASLERGGSGDYVLDQLLGLLLGSVTLEKFEILNGDDPVVMCTAYYLVASRHLIHEEFVQATAMLDKCLSLRMPMLESYLAWIDLIALDPTRG